MFLVPYIGLSQREVGDNPLGGKTQTVNFNMMVTACEEVSCRLQCCNGKIKTVNFNMMVTVRKFLVDCNAAMVR